MLVGGKVLFRPKKNCNEKKKNNLSIYDNICAGCECNYPRCWILKQNAVCGSLSFNTSIEIIFNHV